MMIGSIIAAMASLMIARGALGVLAERCDLSEYVCSRAS
jgi:hypothetical protein